MAEWEFDAPQFVDFTRPELDEYSDTWFDTHIENDDFVRLSKEGDDIKTETKKPQRVLRSTGGVKQQTNVTAEDIDTAPKSPRYLNAKPARVLVGEKHASQTNMKTICSSPKKRQKISTDTNHYLPSSSSKQPAVLSSSTHSQEAATLNYDCPAANTRLRSPIDSKSAHTVVKERSSKSPKKNRKFVKSPKITSSQNNINTSASKRSPKIVPSVKRSQSLRCNMPSRIGSAIKLKREHIEIDTSKESQPTQADVNSSSDTKTKSTEELELEKIAAMKQEVARTLKHNEESYKKAITSHGYAPMRSCQPSTVAVAFNFKTDERLKNPEGHLNEPKVKDFASSLREALPQSVLPSKLNVPGLTRPQPFKLTSAKSTSSLAQPGKYESVAERVIAFHKKTPDRFRSNPHGPNGRSRSANKNDAVAQSRRLRSQSPKITVPKTPTLTARGRSRPVHAISREVKEQLEFEEHQKQQFKANPVNPRVFIAPSVPKVAPKPVTIIEEFNLYSQRSSSFSDLMAAAEDSEEKYEFHAKPVNPKILAGPVGVKPVERRPITVAESPAFALKHRTRLPVELPEREEVKESIKVNPVPYSGIPFKPRLAHHFTIPEPFSVEERSRAMLTRKEQKIQQVLEEERKAREFYAQDLPKEEPDTLPPKQVKPPTLPEPFHLEVDDRGERYQKEFKYKLEEEDRLARELANFKAAPNNLHKEPFLPAKSSKPLTERSNFALNTDVRAAQREAFDQHLKAKEAEIEAMKRQREERLQREEQSAVARMRAEAVHKATGIRRYKSVIVKPSDKPPTEAQSPRFSQRTRTRHNNSEL